MERISRYILVLVTIITCAIILPSVYWMAFDKPLNAPFVMYSCTDNDFMITQSADGELERTDTRGNNYTREEYEQRLPLLYTRQLLISGTMPDTIRGIAMDMRELSRAKSSFRYKPDEKDAPQPKLYPLFESESGRANLEMPDDYFRITWRMEFINAASNKIDEQKSQLFSAALFKKGFVFPAKRISGLPTTRKSCDEGYFIIDSSEQFFHVKMIQGAPYVFKVDLPQGFIIQYISCVDNKDKKFYAYLFGRDNGIYILTQDEYELIKLPVDGFDPDNCSLRIFGDIFHYDVVIQSEDHLQVDVLNYADYTKVDTYRKSWLKRSDLPAGKIAASIFPLQLSMSDNNSSYNNFYFVLPAGLWWLVVNLVLMGIHFFILAGRKARISKHIFDLAIIAVTGIFGFIAVNFFQNKFFD